MQKLKMHYFVVLYCLLALLIVAYDLKHFYFFLLPVFIFISYVVVYVVFRVKRLRRFMKIGYACLVCTMIVLILTGIASNELNKRNYVDAAVLISRVEKFRLEQRRYPTKLEMIEIINPEARLQSGIRLQCLRNKSPYRGRCTYSPEKNDSYFFSIDVLPKGYIAWRPKTKVWDYQYLD